MRHSPAVSTRASSLKIQGILSGPLPLGGGIVGCRKWKDFEQKKKLRLVGAAATVIIA